MRKQFSGGTLYLSAFCPEKHLMFQSAEPEHTNSPKACFEWCGFPSWSGKIVRKSGSCFVGRITNLGPVFAGTLNHFI